MAKPYDVTTKDLIERHPADWLAYVGLSVTGVEVVDADLSTVISEADKVLRVTAPESEIVHLDLQAGYERALGERALEYNVLLFRRHGVPIRTFVILLRREADGPAMTGRVERRYGDGTRYHEFLYEVVRVWEQPVDAVLAGGLGTLPLAPLAATAEMRLPDVIRQMEERIASEASVEEAATLWTSTYILMGLKYAEAVAEQLLKGVRQMKESVTYQAILQEGEARGEARWRAEEARAMLLRIGAKRFGAPDEATQAAIAMMTDVAQLEFMIERTLEMENWGELLTAN